MKDLNIYKRKLNTLSKKISIKCIFNTERKKTMRMFKNWYHILYTIILIIYVLAVIFETCYYEFEFTFTCILLFIGFFAYTILYGFGEIIYYLKFNEKTIICKNYNCKNSILNENCYMCGKKLNKDEGEKE